MLKMVLKMATSSTSSFVVVESITEITRNINSSSTRHPNSGRYLQREWQGTTLPRVPTRQTTGSDVFSFGITSYNVLCQETLEETSYLYKTCANEWLQWNYRWNLLSEEFPKLKSDIFCLQEVEEKYYETHFKRLMNDLGFDGIYKKRTGFKADGCAIFWRRNKFSMDKVDFVEYQVANTYLDRDNVGVVVRLICLNPRQPRSSTERKIVVANTHLLFNPGRGDIKLCQLAMLLARINQLAKKVSSQGETNFPAIMCGDFNAVPYSPLYDLIANGELIYDGLRRGDIAGQRPGGPYVYKPLLPVQCRVNEMCECFEDSGSLRPTAPVARTECNSPEGRLCHGLNMRSTYDHITKRGLSEVSTYHGREAYTVDYIFYSSSVGRAGCVKIDGNLVCKRRYALPDVTDVVDVTGPLPNRTCGSDHLPLAAEFELS